MTKMWQEILEQPSVLERCKSSSEAVISTIAEYLKKQTINSVVIAARGTSDHAGVYAKYIIEHTLHIPVALAAPSIYTIYNKNLNLKDSLVIGISQSGKAADVLEVIKGANQCGATTITVTNDAQSPLASEARFHLFCNAGVEESVAATKTFTSQLYLIAQLVAAWSGDESMKKELDLVPQNITKIIETSAQQVKEKAERYLYMNECFVLARGMNYPVALEGALKIQETSYVRAKAYAVSDFHHGPYAMIDRNMPVFVYAPEGPALKDIIEMINKLKNSQAEVIVISNNKEVLEMGNCSFEIPQTDNDMISPFYNAVIAQMFACSLTLAKGLNPDSPRGLNKVTVTR